MTPIADQQILRGAPATLSWQYLDATGEPTDPGTVTVGVARADGTSVIAAGTATGGTAANPRTVALTAVHTAALDLLTATWTRTADGTTYTTTAAVVGGYYFTVAQLRAREKALADAQKYPTADLIALRRDVEDEFEEICEVAFVPRYARRRIDGTGSSCLVLPMGAPRRIVAVTQVAGDGSTSAWTAGEVAGIRLDDSGEVTSQLRGFPAGAGNLIVAWEHGYDRPPADLRDRAMQRLRHHATRPKTAIPDRATSFQVEGGSVYRLDQARRRKTGIPDIDAVLDRYSMATHGIA